MNLSRWHRLLTHFAGRFPVVSQHLSVAVAGVILLQEGRVRQVLQQRHGVRVDGVRPFDESGLEHSGVSLRRQPCRE